LNFKFCADLEKNLNGTARVPEAHDGPWPCVRPARVHARSHAVVAQPLPATSRRRCRPTDRHLLPDVARLIIDSNLHDTLRHR
jgi:hypothetical protein